MFSRDVVIMATIPATTTTVTTARERRRLGESRMLVYGRIIDPELEGVLLIDNDGL